MSDPSAVQPHPDLGWARSAQGQAELADTERLLREARQAFGRGDYLRVADALHEVRADAERNGDAGMLERADRLAERVRTRLGGFDSDGVDLAHFELALASGAPADREHAPSARWALVLVPILVLVAVALSFVYEFALAFAGLGSVLPFLGWAVALIAGFALCLRPALMSGLLAVAAGAELSLLATGLLLEPSPKTLSDCATVEETGVAGVSDWYWAAGIAAGVGALAVMLAGVAFVRRRAGVLVLALGGAVLTGATLAFLTGAVTRIEAAELTLTGRADCGTILTAGWETVAVGLLAAATLLAGVFANRKACAPGQ